MRLNGGAHPVYRLPSAPKGRLLRRVSRFGFGQSGLLNGLRMVPFFLDFDERVARLECSALERGMAQGVARGSEHCVARLSRAARAGCSQAPLTVLYHALLVVCQNHRDPGIELGLDRLQ